jgi:hypothetical protein
MRRQVKGIHPPHRVTVAMREIRVQWPAIIPCAPDFSPKFRWSELLQPDPPYWPCPVACPESLEDQQNPQYLVLEALGAGG